MRQSRSRQGWRSTHPTLSRPWHSAQRTNKVAPPCKPNRNTSSSSSNTEGRVCGQVRGRAVQMGAEATAVAEVQVRGLDSGRSTHDRAMAVGEAASMSTAVIHLQLSHDLSVLCCLVLCCLVLCCVCLFAPPSSPSTLCDCVAPVTHCLVSFIGIQLQVMQQASRV